MTNSNNLSPIPFYSSLEQQDYRKWWAYKNVYPLVVSKTKLIPFFFRVDHPNATLIGAKIFKVCCKAKEVGGDYNYDFSYDFYINTNQDPNYWFNQINPVLRSIAGTNYTDFYYLGDKTDFPIEKGQFFWELTFQLNSGTVTVYSDVFTCVDDEELANYTKIEWYCSSDLQTEDSIIPYSSGYHNILYIDTDVAEPIYEFEEEGEDRNGYFFPIKQISYKRYVFKFIAPEYVCDSMRLIRMSDYATITAKTGETFSASQFAMEVTWLEGGHYASVECEFTTQTVVKMIGKAVTV